MINLDSITNENNKEHNEKWPFIPDHSYRILIIGGSGSGKTNTLLNVINEKDDIDKIYLYTKCSQGISKNPKIFHKQIILSDIFYMAFIEIRSKIA